MIKKGIQQRMKHPITMPIVLAAFCSRLNLANLPAIVNWGTFNASWATFFSGEPVLHEFEFLLASLLERHKLAGDSKLLSLKLHVNVLSLFEPLDSLLCLTNDAQ
jgi:hypothetical protein